MNIDFVLIHLEHGGGGEVRVKAKSKRGEEKSLNIEPYIRAVLAQLV
jgi:hypothetical protein